MGAMLPGLLLLLEPLAVNSLGRERVGITLEDIAARVRGVGIVSCSFPSSQPDGSKTDSHSAVLVAEHEQEVPLTNAALEFARLVTILRSPPKSW